MPLTLERELLLTNWEFLDQKLKPGLLNPISWLNRKKSMTVQLNFGAPETTFQVILLMTGIPMLGIILLMKLMQ